MARCVVVGSGISGLVTALTLARLGHAVEIVEAGPRPAPLLHGFVRNGLHFDTSFHTGGGLDKDGILYRWLAALGLLEGKNALKDIRLGQREVFFFADGRKTELPSGVEAVAASIENQFPGSGQAMRDFVESTTAMLGHSPYLNPELGGKPEPLAYSDTCLMEKLVASRLPPPVQAMLACRCLLYGTLPDRASFAEYSLVAGPYFQSSGTWHGGGLALARALLTRLADKGIKPCCGDPVTGIEADSNGVKAVTLANGRTLPCEYCFFTGHPSQLAGLLPRGTLRPAYLNRIAGMEEGMSAFILFAETGTALQSGQAIYLLPDSSQVGSFPALGEADPTIAIFCDRERPDGRKAVMVVAHLEAGMEPANARDYGQWKDAMTTLVRNEVEKRLPELKGNWKIVDSASPVTMRHQIHGSRGSLYGLCHNVNEMPLLPMTKVKGLYLAGQNIILAGILGGIASAALAVGFAFGHDAVLRDFREYDKCKQNG